MKLYACPTVPAGADPEIPGEASYAPRSQPLPGRAPPSSSVAAPDGPAPSARLPTAGIIVAGPEPLTCNEPSSGSEVIGDPLNVAPPAADDAPIALGLDSEA